MAHYQGTHVDDSIIAQQYEDNLFTDFGLGIACGGVLHVAQLGVANKTLPCGTKVTLRFHGRAVTVSVIDRGPYVGGRVYDLTSATKSKLGFGSTGTVWSNR